MATPPIPIPVAGSDTLGTTAAHFEKLVHHSPDRRDSEYSTTHDIKDEVFDKSQGALPYSTSHGLVRTESAGVDVGRAEQDFARLNRQLSAYSERSRRLSRQQSKQPAKVKQGDVEKGVGPDESSEEPWDLETTLRGAKAADREAGIKVKRIGAFHPLPLAPTALTVLGVIWDNLTVRGVGGAKNIVKTFPDAFVDFFNLPGTIMSLFGWGKKAKNLT